jgi:hypothetical protein
MNATETKTHPLKVAERAAHDAFAAAMRARDAIDACGSAEWRAAHEVAKVKADEWGKATQAVYDAAKACRTAHEALAAGLEFAPYWWVRHGAYAAR